MNAFVLSGGGNLGSIQAGQLEGLAGAGIRPDLLVGTSIGAANAAFLAAGPGPERTRELADVWRRTRSGDVFPRNPVRAGRATLWTFLDRCGLTFKKSPRTRRSRTARMF